MKLLGHYITFSHTINFPNNYIDIAIEKFGVNNCIGMYNVPMLRGDERYIRSDVFDKLRTAESAARRLLYKSTPIRTPIKRSRSLIYFAPLPRVKVSS